ncbi:hypothetical protein ACFSL4_12550 [Streptomyces caeni]|uniref:Peptidase inhibitor family I36 protein n=1 Tax=Streptomyces caeni TaxID=2307231 RepID=A0ABW4IQJ2_9ACTN
MHLRTRAGTALGAAVLLVAALAAAPGHLPALGAHPRGGCRFKVLCGTVQNNTTRSLKICLSWDFRGADQAYQPEDHCGSVAYIRPYAVYGVPQLKDVDAFYIPNGTAYYGLYSGIPKRWTHTGSGWWKFGDSTSVQIDWTA